MSQRLVSHFTKSWFSNYDDRLAFDVTCPMCESSVPVDVTWSEAREGLGGNADVLPNFKPAFVIPLHLCTNCRCGTPITIYFSGAAGGRHGEVQYGVAGLRYGETTLV